MYSRENASNIIRNYEVAQGMTHSADSAYQILRDYHIRYITIENSGTTPVGVAITSYVDGETPPITFSLCGGEIKHLGVNSHGSNPQFIWLLDLKTGDRVGAQTIIKSSANQYVIRDGLNKKWIQGFHRAVYAAAH